MSPSEISALVLTFNERENIGRTLSKLSFVEQIVVVDSFSTDGTYDIMLSVPRLKLFQHPFVSFADQCNFGLSQISTPWVLSIDADYVLTDDLIAEIEKLPSNSENIGYRARFTYCVHGQPLRASLYPPRVVLYRRQDARYENDGHGHRIRIDGRVEELAGKIFHDDRKPIDRWLSEQDRYSRQEAEKLLRTASSELNFPDRVRKKMILAPALVFLYTLFWKRLLFDGPPGWFYVLQRTYAEVLLSVHLLDCQCRGAVQK